MMLLHFNSKSGLFDSGNYHIQHPAAGVVTVTLAVVDSGYCVLPKGNQLLGRYGFDFIVVSRDCLI